MILGQQWGAEPVESGLVRLDGQDEERRWREERQEERLSASVDMRSAAAARVVVRVAGETVGEADLVFRGGFALVMKLVVSATMTAMDWASGDAQQRWASHSRVVTRRLISEAEKVAVKQQLPLVFYAAPGSPMRGELGGRRFQVVAGNVWGLVAEAAPADDLTMPHGARFTEGELVACPPGCPARPELVEREAAGLPLRTWVGHGQPAAGVWWGAPGFGEASMWFAGQRVAFREARDGRVVVVVQESGGTTLEFDASVQFRLSRVQYLADVDGVRKLVTAPDLSYDVGSSLPLAVRVEDRSLEDDAGGLPGGADCSMLGGPGAESGEPADGIGPDLGPILERLRWSRTMPSYPPGDPIAGKLAGIVRTFAGDVEALVAEVAARRAVPTGIGRSVRVGQMTAVVRGVPADVDDSVPSWLDSDSGRGASVPRDGDTFGSGDARLVRGGPWATSEGGESAAGGEQAQAGQGRPASRMALVSVAIGRELVALGRLYAWCVAVGCSVPSATETWVMGGEAFPLERLREAFAGFGWAVPERALLITVDPADNLARATHGVPAE